MSYEINQEAARIITEDRVPEDVLKELIADFGDRSEPVAIKRFFNGGSELLSFDAWATDVIQEHDHAVDVAQRMLAGDTPYHYNETDPEFYERFEIADRGTLAEQVKAYLESPVD